MNYTRDILDAANNGGIGDAYYKLCKEHPLLPGTSVKKVLHKDVLSAAEGVVLLSKLAGPGTVFKLGGLPNGVALNFIIQSGGSVETHFVIGQTGHEQPGTFAILCNEALKHAGQPTPVPGYPRPICSSAIELVAAFCVLQELVLALSEAFREAG